MSSDLFVQSLARGSLRVRRRKHLSGELMVTFRDPSVQPIHITDGRTIDVSRHATPYAIQRSNIRQLISAGHLEVVV